jgi:hypothetical protein
MSIGAQIPVIAEKPLAVCGCRKFQVDSLDDHLCTCTTHSGVKKAHDWVVDQLADIFRTTHKVKTQQVVRSRGQYSGDIELVGYLANVASPVSVVLDLGNPHPDRRPYTTRSHLHTSYTPHPTPGPRSSPPRTLRSFGFFVSVT